MKQESGQELQPYITKKTEIDLSFEVVILVIGGVFFLLFGVLLFLITKGMLPYTEGSMYGLFVVLVSIQAITMGKTPFGDLLRSWFVVVIGIVTAMTGTLAIFYPEHLGSMIRLLAGLIVLVTGALGLIQLLTAKDKAQAWLKIPGILQHLTVACILVYGIEVVLGIVTLLPGIMPDQVTAVFCLIIGASIFFLAWTVHKVHHKYPGEDEKTNQQETPSHTRFCLFQKTSLTMGNAISTYQGCLMILLGFLIFFSILGILPSFNADGQLGLLLVLTSLQLLALGQFVGSTVTRSWPVVIFGILCAGIGIFSCIVPGIVSEVIQSILGLQNLVTGVMILVTQIIAPTLYGIKHPPEEAVTLPPIIKRLLFILMITGLVTIIFGINMFMPVLLPNLIGMIGVAILLPLLVIVIGILMLLTVSITQKLEQGALSAS